MITIWHNPNCSKSRATLQYLKNLNKNLTIKEYLKQLPSRKEIEEILNQGLTLKDIIRTGESVYEELNMVNLTNEDEIINILVKNPILIQRPIVTFKNKSAIARPLENIIKLLEE
jgi:arsenate reductase